MWVSLQLALVPMLGTLISFVSHWNNSDVNSMDDLILQNLTNLTDTNFTVGELIAIKKFRPMVDDVLEDDFDRTNHSLLRWLKASHFNLKAANSSMHRSHQWKLTNNISTILDESFMGQKHELCVTDGVDKEGNLLTYMLLDQEDIRKWILSGHENNFTRLIYKCAARTYDTLKKAWRKTKKDDMGIIIIANLAGYNLRQHACLRCFKVYTDYAKQYDDNFPGIMKMIVGVNGPTIAKPMVELMKHVLAPETAKLINFFGSDRREWLTFLLERISPDQLSIEFGGTRKLPQLSRKHKQI